MNKKTAQKVRLTFDWKPVDEWIKANPDVSFSAFKKIFPKFPFSDATFYGRKRKVTGNGPKYTLTRKTKTLYETLGTIEVKELKGLDGLSGMKKLLTFLDKHNKTNVEIVRLAEPDSIEIRRFTR